MWSLYENKKRLEPLIFSNGKSQDDIVKEVLDAIKSGNKIIFIKGVCGTGKSAIALNIAKELGRASIVVPIKNLQKQYEDDYTGKKYILRDNGEKLKIKVIKGRQNFSCPFMKENNVKEEKNSTLNIFDSPFKKQQSWKLPADESCDNSLLPCKIEINKKNEKKIREYLKMNEKIKDNLSLNFVRRMSIAPVCRHYRSDGHSPDKV